MTKNNMSTLELESLRSRLVESTKYLALDYDSQCKKSSLPNDIIPDDIANDWEWIMEISKILEKKHMISHTSLATIMLIDKRFNDASSGQIHYDAEIWTDLGLKSHDFWQKQRELAQSLLEQLIQ